MSASRSRIRRIYRKMTILVLVLFPALSCKKFVQVPLPSTQLVSGAVYSSDPTAAAVLTGIYDRMMNGMGITSGNVSISFLAGLSADELQNYSTDVVSTGFYTNALTSFGFSAFWGEAYQYIYTANAAIEGLSSSTGLTPAVKQQLLGEAKFLRAFFYFNLANLFENVPLILASNYQTNEVIANSSQDQVYQQVIADLKDAQALLSPNFLGPDALTTVSDRVRPTKWAADGLLARVYLYTKDWTDAIIQSDSVIGNSAEFALVPNLNGVFLANSTEAIWQLEPVQPGYNTWDGDVFVLTSAPANGTLQSVSLSPFLLNSFEPNDNRYTTWVGQFSANGQTYYFPYKYEIGAYGQPLQEYQMVMRLAEQYLIRAEAEAQSNDLLDATVDLDTIRARAGLPDVSDSISSSQSTLLTAIYHERQVELFTEWGNRWSDLKRTNLIDNVMQVVTPVKSGGAPWNGYQKLYPIPLSEIQLDPNLIQNPGYQQ